MLDGNTAALNQYLNEQDRKIRKDEANQDYIDGRAFDLMCMAIAEGADVGMEAMGSEGFDDGDRVLLATLVSAANRAPSPELADTYLLDIGKLVYKTIMEYLGEGSYWEEFQEQARAEID